jgi:hypothetical protein
MKNKGSTLVLLVIIIGLVIILGTSVLYVVIKQYEIKKFNTDAKQSFYISETGLNEAYVKSCVLIDESIRRALNIAEEYLALNPLNIIEAENIFITNYKLNIKSNIKNKINTSANPSVEIRNEDSLVFTGNTLTVLLSSRYINNSVEKLIWVELKMSVPEFDDVAYGVYDVSDYIEFDNWSI